MGRESIVLGQRYRDTVSGWEGTAVARYEYMNGCVRCELAGADKDGKPAEFVFDQQQVVPVDAAPTTLRPARATGGPRSSLPVARR